MRIFDVYMKFLIIFFLVHVALFLPIKSSLADVNFEKLYGSDLSMGVGARATGLGAHLYPFPMMRPLFTGTRPVLRISPQPSHSHPLYPWKARFHSARLRLLFLHPSIF
jgi:hypothetical protein